MSLRDKIQTPDKNSLLKPLQKNINKMTLQGQNTISIVESTKLNDPLKLSKYIYKNFIHLLSDNIEHSEQYINKVLTDPNSKCFFVYLNIPNKGKYMIGYLISDIRQLQDGRRVVYISYLYVESAYRDLKIGSLLMKIIIKKTISYNIKYIMLTCDGTDQKLIHFYNKFNFSKEKGGMYGQSNNKHIVMTLYI